MRDEDRLEILKKDLQMLTSSNDEYLEILLKQSKAAITREGIDLEIGIEGDMAVIQYAAYLFRKRSGQDTSMPRYLRLQLNNLKISQKGKRKNEMTFDDGILTVYRTENTAQPGKKPVQRLKVKGRHYFNYGELGYNRIYRAKQAGQQVEAVVNIPGWEDIQMTDVCVMENGDQFRILTRQPTLDENGLRITRLSLERIGEKYAV